MTGCLKQEINSQTMLLKKRIERFYFEINPAKAWELFSKDLKKAHENNKEEFIKYFDEQNPFKELKNIQFSIEEINIKNNKARVKMRFSGEVISSGEKFDEILYDYWIFENNNWYMDDPNRTE
jgi:hypothetical protein